MRIELDKKALFALASDTRVEILRALQPMRRTVTQLADTLEVDKAAVHRHLQKLVEGELVKRYEDHGFVYYGLSWKSRDLLSPTENTKIIVLLGTFFWAVIGGIAAAAVAMWSAVGGSSFYAGRTEGVDTGLLESDPATIGLTPDLSVNALHPMWPILAVILSIAAVALFVVAWRRVRRPRQRGPPAAEPEAASL
ncbi:MAG TPA: winged helix-turn-helix domain-containing protein [Thermoplasmata archaeon]|nr:winged helix-turn-helix domain-containing protein [Thermoplasmata archaeon]